MSFSVVLFRSIARRPLSTSVSSAVRLAMVLFPRSMSGTTSSPSSILVELELIDNEAGLAVVVVVVSVTFPTAPDLVERQSTSCAIKG